DGHLIGRDDRDLPLVANLRTPRIPGLPPAGEPRIAAVEVPPDTLEAQVERIAGLGLETASGGDERAGDPARELACRQDFDVVSLEEIGHQRSPTSSSAARRRW